MSDPTLTTVINATVVATHMPLTSLIWACMFFMVLSASGRSSQCGFLVDENIQQAGHEAKRFSPTWISVVLAFVPSGRTRRNSRFQSPEELPCRQEALLETGFAI